MYAANLGLIENVKLLLANGADVSMASTDGDTAISLAARPDSSVNRKERQQVVELLQEYVDRSND